MTEIGIFAYQVVEHKMNCFCDVAGISCHQDAELANIHVLHLASRQSADPVQDIPLKSVKTRQIEQTNREGKNQSIVFEKIFFP